MRLQLGSRPARPRRVVATSLFAATASLLGGPSKPSLAQETDGGWKFDTAISYYQEPDRVTDLSANVLVQRAFTRGGLSMRVALDSLTGASASGAVPAVFPQTFTSPSGKGSYSIDAGTTPLDPTFLDTRVALGVNWMQPLGTKGDLDLGLTASSEYDYFHAGINGRYSLGLNERNTSLQVGFAVAADTIDPVGGAPIPFAAMLPAGTFGNKDGDDSKTVFDLVFGVVQVFGKNTIGQFNYSLSRSSGYLTDPYKLLTVVDPVSGDPVPGPGLPFLYLFEARPDQRTKHSLYGEVKHRIGRPVIDASYRYMTDDWGVDSHTLEFRWRQPIGAGWYVQPHVRYYMQAAADFYRPYLRNGDPLPDHASADYRLGEMDATTLGVKVGRTWEQDREWSIRVEYYRQVERGPPGAGFGSLGGLDLFPTVDAVLSQFEYRF